MAPLRISVWDLLAALILVVLGLGIFCRPQRASADHLVYLPYVPNTPLMQTVIQTQEYTWCVDDRAAHYPGFVNQLRDVQNQYTARVGIRHWQVAFSDPTCKVRHTMPDRVDCSRCAAYIYYANDPVVVVYKWALGYSDWRSTQGHELGHGLLGLHEQYRDSGGVIECVYREDTVMSCGPPYVRYPQPRDVYYGCLIIATAWCGSPPPPACDPCWDGQRWVFRDGWSYQPSDGTWWGPTGLLEFSACNQDRIRWAFRAERWVTPGSMLFDPAVGYWARAPEC